MGPWCCHQKYTSHTATTIPKSGVGPRWPSGKAILGLKSWRGTNILLMVQKSQTTTWHVKKAGGYWDIDPNINWYKYRISEASTGISPKGKTSSQQPLKGSPATLKNRWNPPLQPLRWQFAAQNPNLRMRAWLTGLILHDLTIFQMKAHPEFSCSEKLDQKKWWLWIRSNRSVPFKRWAVSRKTSGCWYFRYLLVTKGTGAYVSYTESSNQGSQTESCATSSLELASSSTTFTKDTSKDWRTERLCSKRKVKNFPRSRPLLQRAPLQGVVLLPEDVGSQHFFPLPAASESTCTVRS